MFDKQLSRETYETYQQRNTEETKVVKKFNALPQK